MLLHQKYKSNETKQRCRQDIREIFFFQNQGLTTDKEHSCILDVECICLSASSTDMKYEYMKHDGFSGYKVLTWQRFSTGFAL